MKAYLVLFALVFSSIGFSQNDNYYEKYPAFEDCQSQSGQALKQCFNNKVYNLLYTTFIVPDEVAENNYKGDVGIMFEVDKEGNFKVVYVDAIYNSLKDEAKRVFSEFPKIQPATYNGKPAFKQFSVKLLIPLQDQTQPINTVENLSAKEKKDKELNQLTALEEKAKQEFDSVTKAIQPYTNNAYRSQINIPFSHENYARFDRSLNMVGTNSHTASKPYRYEVVANYYDFTAENDSLKKQTSTYAGRKLWNDHLVQLQGADYWFTVDPVLDLQVGKDTDAEFSSTYNNTRGVYIQGGLGKDFSFSASVFESQGRFADYYNRYAESLKAFGPDPAIVPGRGIAKRFGDDGYDYPVAEGYLSYTPAKFLNVQFGHGKNFIGDGYRSLFQSDVASPYPYLKLNTKFWKIQYTNTWTWLRDVRPEVTEDGAFLTKYIANHYLSWNVTKRLNVGLFESVIWTNSNDRGFDVNYLNPVIFYRAIEFETGQDAGNAIVGASAKYKFNDNINAYSQFVLDEFSLNDVKAGNKSYKNKFGFQLGAKYYNAFKVKNLMLQAEYNQVRPYTYSHNSIVLNYAHNNQSMAHLWGANFRELVVIGRYQYKRWLGEAKLVTGVRGFDFNTGGNTAFYGGDLFGDEDTRPFDNGVEIGQGNAVNSLFASGQVAYVVNPTTNLKVFANATYRNFNPEVNTLTEFKNSTVWFNFGIRTDLFNWYTDY
jgi:hypothetical protein